MERIDRILNHPLFQEHLKQNERAEKDRSFCRHDMGHFLDVARIAALLNAEEEQGIEKPLLYAAALLHDLGRHIQYELATPHEKVGAQIAPAILQDCGFLPEEIQEIVYAIGAHRDSKSVECHGLTGLLFRADKLSRACYACNVEADCNWKRERKNLKLRY